MHDRLGYDLGGIFAKMRRVPALAVMALAFALIPIVQSQADQDNHSQPRPENLRPMSEVVTLVHNTHEGHVLKIKLKPKKQEPGWRYEVKLLIPDGRVKELEFDAETLTLLKMKIEGPDSEHDRSWTDKLGEWFEDIWKAE